MLASGPRKLPAAGAILLAAVAAGLVDHVTGHDATLEALYLIPVGLAAWVFGRSAGLTIALGCALLGLASDWLLPGHFNHPIVPAWNALSRLAIYAISAWVVDAGRSALVERERMIGELQEALAEIRTLRGLVPICAWCKCIRDDEHGGRWTSIEAYVAAHSEATFTHGICPPCARRVREDASSTTAAAR